jgi:hypothetical protein
MKEKRIKWLFHLLLLMLLLYGNLRELKTYTQERKNNVLYILSLIYMCTIQQWTRVSSLFLGIIKKKKNRRQTRLFFFFSVSSNPSAVGI